MALNNLRIVYQNLADTATISATQTTGLENLKSDNKGTSCSPNASTAIITVTFSSDQTVGAVVLPFCNLSSSATIAFDCKNAAGVVVATRSAVACCPYQQVIPANWGSTPTGVNAYAYGGGTTARAYLPNKTQVSCRSVVITISNTATIDLARLIVGGYWSPVYNTGYGMSVGYTETGTNARSEAGNLVTTRGVKFKTLDFDINWMTAADRKQLDSIIRGNGVTYPLFVSLFPENTDDLEAEGVHQIYGKLNAGLAASYTNYGFYSTSLSLEEV